MKIDSGLVTQLGTQSNKEHLNSMPKLGVANEDFTKARLNEKNENLVNPGVTLELNIENLEEISTVKKSFTPVGGTHLENIEVIEVGQISKYLGLLNAEVSLEDLKVKGIDAFSNYQNMGNVWDDKSRMEDFFANGAEKYSEILSQLKGKYSEGSEIFEKQKSSLDTALTRYFENKVEWVQTYSKLGAKSLNEYNSSQYKASAENTAKNYINNFDKDKDVRIQLKNALEHSFPKESTSVHNMTLEDYETIRQATLDNFNKGTGLDLMESLSKNQNLSDVLRKAYEGLLKQHQNGSSSLNYNYQV